MIAQLLTFWHWLQSKGTVIGLITVAVSIALWRVVTTLISTGAQQERLKQMEQSVRNTAKEKEVEANIDRLSNSAVRDGLRKHWSRTD